MPNDEEIQAELDRLRAEAQKRSDAELMSSLQEQGFSKEEQAIFYELGKAVDVAIQAAPGPTFTPGDIVRAVLTERPDLIRLTSDTLGEPEEWSVAWLTTRIKGILASFGAELARDHRKAQSK